MEEEMQAASDSKMQSTTDGLIKPDVGASSRDATHGQVVSEHEVKLSSENDSTQEVVMSENSNNKDIQRIELSMNELMQQVNNMRSEILNTRESRLLLKDLPEKNENVNIKEVHTTPLDVILQDVHQLNNVIQQKLTTSHETVIIKEDVSSLKADAQEDKIFSDDMEYAAEDLTQENIAESDNGIKKDYQDILLSIDELIEQVNQIRAENLNPQRIQTLPQQSSGNVDLKEVDTTSIDTICKEIRNLKNVIKKEGITSPEHVNLRGRLSSPLSSISEEDMISLEISIKDLNLHENITLQENSLLPEGETIQHFQQVSQNLSPKHLCASLESLIKPDEVLAEKLLKQEFDSPSENVMLEEMQSSSENVQQKTQIQCDGKTLSENCPIEQTSPENITLKKEQFTPEKMTLQDDQSSPENMAQPDQIPSCNVAEQEKFISSQIESLHVNMSPENVFDFMSLSRSCGKDAIFQKCLRVVQSQTRASLSSINFKKALINDILEVLKLPALGLEREVELLHYIILWLQWNDYTSTTRDTFLQHIDIKAISIKEFADIVEKFPQFFSDSEVAAIFMSLTKPSSRNVPNGWGTSVRSHSMFYTDASLTSVFRDFQDYALKLETTTGMFKHCTRDTWADNSQEQSALMTFAIKLSKKFPEEETALVMLELSFGQESLAFPDFELILYVGEYNEFAPKAVDIIEYWLVSAEGHYLVMLKNPWKIYKGIPFEFKIQFTLRKNRPDIMFVRLDQSKRGKSVLRKNYNYIGIRLLSTELIFFKTLMNTNDFCISAFFVDSCKDYKRCLFRKNL